MGVTILIVVIAVAFILPASKNPVCPSQEVLQSDSQWTVTEGGAETLWQKSEAYVLNPAEVNSSYDVASSSQIILMVIPDAEKEKCYDDSVLLAIDAKSGYEEWVTSGHGILSVVSVPQGFLVIQPSTLDFMDTMGNLVWTRSFEAKVLFKYIGFTGTDWIFQHLNGTQVAYVNISNGNMFTDTLSFSLLAQMNDVSIIKNNANQMQVKSDSANIDLLQTDSSANNENERAILHDRIIVRISPTSYPYETITVYDKASGDLLWSLSNVESKLYAFDSNDSFISLINDNRIQIIESYTGEIINAIMLKEDGTEVDLSEHVVWLSLEGQTLFVRTVMPRAIFALKLN